MSKVELKHISDERLKREICDDDTNVEYFLEEEKVNFEDEQEHPKRNFLLSSLSIDEKRISALIVGLVLSLIFAGFNYIWVGDITNNLTNIITTLIYAIAGINITDSIVSKIRPKVNDSDTNLVCPSENDDTSSKKRIILKRVKQ